MKVRRGHAHAGLAARYGSRPGGCVLLITIRLNLGNRTMMKMVGLHMDYDEDGWLEYGFTDTDIAYSLKY